MRTVANERNYWQTVQIGINRRTRVTQNKNTYACIYVGQWWSERRDEISGILEELADINVFRLSIKAERQRCRHIITESVTMINESSMKLLWSRTKGPLIFFFCKSIAGADHIELNRYIIKMPCVLAKLIVFRKHRTRTR